MEAKKKYDYVRVPVSPAERAMLNKMVNAGTARTAGAALHMLAFDLEDYVPQMTTVRVTAEQLADIHAELMHRLRTIPEDRQMYETDLIALDDKVMQMADQVSQLVLMLMEIGGIDYGDPVQHPD